GIVVQKFGGTSLADAEKIHRAAGRAIRAKLDGKQVVMAVSAMGHSTDDLLSLAREVSPHPPRRELDMLLTTGEQVSIALMAMAIHAAGHQAISLTGAHLGLMTDSAHTKARIQRIHRDRLNRELEAGNIVIVAGFQGIDASGEITTLGRGASDTTAAALAAVLEADACEIHTDVDGVYTADPRLVPQARKIDRISYDEMLEMAAAGAGVMHSRAIEFGKKFNVPIHVRSALTDAPGTMIMAETPGMEDVTVRGVTLKEDLAEITLTGVPNRPGIAAEIFTEIAKHQVLIDDITQTVYEDGRIANIGFTTTSAYLPEARVACDHVIRTLGVGGVVIDQDVCKVSAIGVGMRSHTGVASTMFAALSAAGINIETISTSEIVIGCVVRRQDGPRALQVVHQAFKLDETDTSDGADES
ncbi:MAG: aspartate kinase, partial [Planctomycetes bacterium]|nr:aspartate kinase [Planctomycetota bacterium]